MASQIEPQNQSDEAEAPTTKLRVSNFTNETTDSDLKDLFVKYGALLDSVTIDSARSNAFMDFMLAEDATAAKDALQGSILHGSKLKIEFATQNMNTYVEQVDTTNGETCPLSYGFTENRSNTYLSTCNACLDLFFHVVPSSKPDDVASRLKSAWESNPLATLKLICHLRGVRGMGKNDRRSFFTAARWLHFTHPQTLAYNLKTFSEFGCYKDLLEILYRLLEGQDVRDIAREKWKKDKKKYGTGREREQFFQRKREEAQMKDENDNKKKSGPREFKLHDCWVKSKRYIEIEKKCEKEKNERRERQYKEKARNLRKERNKKKKAKANERYNSDSAYRTLYDGVADVFAEDLKRDLVNFKSGKLRDISLASKWCPSLDSSYDRATGICESIARRIFPKESDPEYEGIEDSHYAYRVRDRLRKEVLVPLHIVLQLPEVYMSANKWSELPYESVPSVAMKNYEKLFLEHDEQRFTEYLSSVKRGEKNIAAGALLPHEILASLKNESEMVAELQWKRMIQDMRTHGTLKNSIAVCDVSGSMRGTPLNVCTSLGLLISELCEDPWKGRVITFHTYPELLLIEGDNLRSKWEFLKNIEWGQNTNFQKVFDTILLKAVDSKVSKDQMVKRVFVFSDMEFDQASGLFFDNHGEQIGSWELDESLRECGWETDYEMIQNKYKEKGYEAPEMVFWNLRDSPSTPVHSHQNGVALVSGFSKNLVKVFLECGGIINPLDVMEKAISGDLYEKLRVRD